jgi:hypothetical protein
MRRLDGAAELLDGPLDDPATLDGNLRDLALINRVFGGVALSRRAIWSLTPDLERRGATVTMLDVGTGGADIPVALLADASRRGRRLEIVAVDSRPEVIASARRLRPVLDRIPSLRLDVADGLALPYASDSFDVAHASLVLHHLDPPAAVGFLRELGRVARRGVVVNDLTRSRLTLLGSIALGTLATRNPYSRNDAPLSARRAYTRVEARGLLHVAGLRPVHELDGPFRHRWAIAAVRTGASAAGDKAGR